MSSDRTISGIYPFGGLCENPQDAPRQLTVRPQAQHEAIQAARQRQETAEFTAQYARRAGIEGTQSQAVRRCGVRQCRYIGHAMECPRIMSTDLTGLFCKI